MLRGLKKVFSKGRASEVESLEADAAACGNSSPVRVRSKSRAASDDKTEASNFSSLHSMGRDGQSVCDASILADASTPLRRRSGATALSASPPVTGQHGLSASAGSAVPPGLPLPPSACKAWNLSATTEKEGTRPAPEKDTKQQGKMGALFRSGSKNARSSAADAVEVVGLYTGSASDDRDDDGRDDVLPPAASSRNPRHSKAQPVNDFQSDSDGSYPWAGRGGAMRTGSLLATPLQLESRRGPSVIG